MTQSWSLDKTKKSKKVKQGFTEWDPSDVFFFFPLKNFPPYLNGSNHLSDKFQISVVAVTELTHGGGVNEPMHTAEVVLWREATGEMSSRAALAFGYIF